MNLTIGDENIAPSRVCHDDRSEEAREEDRVRDDGKRSRFGHRKRKKKSTKPRVVRDLFLTRIEIGSALFSSRQKDFLGEKSN